MYEIFVQTLITLNKHPFLFLWYGKQRTFVETRDEIHLCFVSTFYLKAASNIYIVFIPFSIIQFRTIINLFRNWILDLVCLKPLTCEVLFTSIFKSKFLPLKPASHYVANGLEEYFRQKYIFILSFWFFWQNDEEWSQFPFSISEILSAEKLNICRSSLL